MAGSNSKKARKHKESKHQHGGGGKLKQPLTSVQKVLMGKGVLVNIGTDKTRRAKKILADKGHGSN